MMMLAQRIAVNECDVFNAGLCVCKQQNNLSIYLYVTEVFNSRAEVEQLVGTPECA